MLAHHTVGGCNLLAGDLLGTGTISSSVCLTHMSDQRQHAGRTDAIESPNANVSAMRKHLPC